MYFLFTFDIVNFVWKTNEGEAESITLILDLVLSSFLSVKGKSCKLYNNKYLIASTQKNIEIFAYTAVLVVFKLWSHKVLFLNIKDTVKK